MTLPVLLSGDPLASSPALANTYPEAAQLQAEALHAFVEAESGLPAIWREQGAPSLSLETGYVSMKWLSPPSRVGRPVDETITVSEDGAKRTQEYDAEAVLSLQFHGRSSSAVAANRVEAALHDSDSLAPLKAVGLAYTGEHTIADLSDIAGAKWEKRTGLDLRFRVRVRHERQSVPFIEESVDSLTIVEPDGTVEGTVGF